MGSKVFIADDLTFSKVGVDILSKSPGRLVKPLPTHVFPVRSLGYVPTGPVEPCIPYSHGCDLYLVCFISAYAISRNQRNALVLLLSSSPFRRPSIAPLRMQNLAKVAASIEARKLKEANTIPEALGALARDPQQVGGVDTLIF